MKLTPEDIKNPGNAAGFVGVTRAGGRGQGKTTGLPWAAKATTADGLRWHGPRRATATQAAQDYCDYINGVPARLSAALKRVGKTRTPREPMDDQEVKHALGVLRDARAQRRGRQGYVYLMSDDYGLKVGYSVKPEARVSELQTGNSREIRLLASMPGTEADERALHLKYVNDNLLLEWFLPSAALYAEFGLEVPSG